MRKAVQFVCGFILCASVAMASGVPQSENHPLTATQVLALLGGGALPEDIAAAVESRGLSFQPSEEYAKLLTQAGANSEILQVIKKAEVHASSDPAAKQESQIEAHLALSAKLLRENKIRDSEREINAAIESGGNKFDAGFIMAEVMRQKQQYPLSVAIYTEIGRHEPDFPEVQTKLGYVLYFAGDAEAALNAARAEQAATPDNIEAHKIAGLALVTMRKLDAALVEYREALRLKPNYELVHYDLGILYDFKNDKQAAIAEYKAALELNPKDTNARFKLGKALRALGRITEANGIEHQTQSAQQQTSSNITPN
jgi:tetratricopeptide (TPR) repeat protein